MGERFATHHDIHNRSGAGNDSSLSDIKTSNFSDTGSAFPAAMAAIREAVGQPIENIQPLATQGKPRIVDMSDAEIKRLEDRIDAVNREGQLRLDAAMARIDGKFDTMMTSMQHMEQSISQTAERISGMKSIIIGTAIATVIAIVGAVFAGQALWASGFSSGQTDRAAVTSTPNTPTH